MSSPSTISRRLPTQGASPALRYVLIYNQRLTESAWTPSYLWLVGAADQSGLGLAPEPGCVLFAGGAKPGA